MQQPRNFISNFLWKCSTRSYSGGYAPSSNNTIEYITIATLGNGIDFGDLLNVVGGVTSMASSTAVFAGGTPSEISDINFAEARQQEMHKTLVIYCLLYLMLVLFQMVISHKCQNLR